jgi:hypothetical protein
MAVVVAIGIATMRDVSDTEVMANGKKSVKASCMKQEATLGDKADEFCTCTADKTTQALGAKGTKELLSSKEIPPGAASVVQQVFDECAKRYDLIKR